MSKTAKPAAANLSTPSRPALRIAALISGGGRTVLNIQNAIDLGNLNAEIAIVIASRPKLAGTERAKTRGLKTKVVDRKRYNTPAEFSDVVWKAIRAADADLVCLAGFLSKLTIPDDYRGRVINVHPALLPSFGGKGMFGHHVHEAVLARGCKASGCTVHICDDQYDNGPIIAQSTCPVLETDTPDTLADRVFEQECLTYPEAIRLLAAGRVLVDLEHNRTRILPAIPPAYGGDLPSRAGWYAMNAHAGQTRANGDPYATHIEAVARALLEHGVTDAATLAAAYLHDVVEKTPVSLHQIRWAFGTRVTTLVDELTVEFPVTGKREPTGQAKHAAILADARTLSESARLIKLADRLDNVALKRATLSVADFKSYAKATSELLEALKPWPHEKLAATVRAAINMQGD